MLLLYFVTIKLRFTVEDSNDTMVTKKCLQKTKQVNVNQSAYEI